MGVIGEAVVVLRPDALGFGTAARKGIDAELAGQDVLGGVGTSADRNAKKIEQDFTSAGASIGASMEKGTSRVSRAFQSAGNTAGSFGLPFSNALTNVGKKIDDTDTKGKHFTQTLSALGGTAVGVGLVGVAAIAAESVHLATGLQAADAQIASHENISVNAANNIGKAFISTAGTVPFSANQLASSFAPVSGQLDQINGKTLTVAQTLKFMAQTGDLAEATNSDLGSTTATTAKIMQSFQIPLKGTTGLTNDLFNTSRVTGVGIDQLGSTIDKLKARLGIAAPTVGDLSSLLVDLNEHGVQGSRGLLVVNSAVTKLLQSVPAVDTAAAKAANTLSNKLASAANTTASASTRLSQAQTSGSTAVANAQQRLVEVQDRIAASSTAAAPTTAQQITLQNAQTAVSQAQASAATKVMNAQTSLNNAQSKAGAIQATASLSTNKQVAAMQTLGLQVYTTSGTFVGMRSIIAQLQPVLAGMTQQQQLATTSQIFGASASKALLATVLAGPAAYDKASKAVRDSSTAHAGAVKQAQTLGRELDVVKSALVDEGDKAGLFLIPKLQEAAKWTAEDVKWLEKHKTVAEALGIALGGVVAVAVGTFAINMGTKVVGSVVKAGQSVGDFASTVGQKLGIVNKEVDETSDHEQAQARQFQTAADQISEAIDLASRNIVYALGQVDASLEGLTTNVQSSTTDIQASFSEINASASTATAETTSSLDGLVTSTTDSGLAIIESNQRVAASFSEVSAASVVSADTTEASQAGLAAKTSATSAETELAGAGKGVGGAGVGGIGGVLTAATAGFAAFTATTALLKSNTLGLGTAVTSVADHVANIFGVGPASKAFTGKDLTSADVPYLQEIVAGQIKHAPLTKAEAKEALSTLHASPTGNAAAAQNSKTSGTLSAQIKTVTGLQQAAYLATVRYGGSSVQAKDAVKSLYATESKFLPGLSKDESTQAVARSIFITTAAIQQLQGKQAKLASEGTVAQTTSNIKDLKSTLKEQQKAGASESTLKDTKASLKTQEDHLAALNSVAQKISRDATIVTKADQTKASIDKVNNQMDQLRAEIKTNPPPKIQSKLTGKFRVTAK
jgi:TP901 family phage tail tape measure protein